MPISLPDEPKDKDFEDLLAVCLMGMGYWVDTNLHLRDDTTEVLEVDVLGTPTNAPLNPVLVEAKSGEAAGFAELFKVSGWINYIGIPRGCLVRTKPLEERKKEAFERIAKATSVSVATCNLPKIDLDFLGIAHTPPSDCLNAFGVAAWYGRIGQRQCLSAFDRFAKSEAQNLTTIADAKSYRWAIEQSFFVRQPIQKASSIYKAFQACPGVTGKVISQMTNGCPDKSKLINKEIWESKDRQYLQYVLLLENIARIAIVKNALLHILQDEQKGEVDGFDWDELMESEMPPSFKDGLNHLRSDPFRNQIPLMYQIFVEVLGGWYSIRNDDDIRLLSSLSGVPAERVEPSLEYLNEIFPTRNGWFIDYKNELRIMKMIPAVCRGTGAFLRNLVYKPVEYSALYPCMSFLITRWHNALYGILEKELSSNTKT